MKNFKLTIEYEGTNYHGWQKQKKIDTIQGQIEKALKIMCGTDVAVTGSGRTDAGVHALGQTANFKCSANISAGNFQKGLNSLLPKDIVIIKCQYAEESFHARFSAKSKTYLYRILNTEIQSALLRNFAWHIKRDINLDLMKQSAEYIKGTHDFKAFEASGSSITDAVRTIIAADLKKQNNLILFKIRGTGFLRYMVRNIIGTLIDVGTKKITSDRFAAILKSKNRANASPTAPAHGLFLMNVEY